MTGQRKCAGPNQTANTHPCTPLLKQWSLIDSANGDSLLSVEGPLGFQGDKIQCRTLLDTGAEKFESLKVHGTESELRKIPPEVTWNQ
ncbi:hypothetical protein U0070_027329 [Myodes glareolus]|uniref:Uncharacterized protein n=1 Tax=Myodes glareolus TaxID=447135 RepID=A0AAW0HW18_MYOGA